MNVAGMVLGIVACIFAAIPLIGAFVAIPCAVVGLPLSAVGFQRKKAAGEGKGMAIAGYHYLRYRANRCDSVLGFHYYWCSVGVIVAIGPKKTADGEVILPLTMQWEPEQPGVDKHEVPKLSDRVGVGEAQGHRGGPMPRLQGHVA